MMNDKCNKDALLRIQEKRREEYSKNKRELRQKVLESFRQLYENLTNHDELTRNEHRSQYYRRPNPNFSNRIMLSEWLLMVPSNFYDNWFVKICPEGHRNLVFIYQNELKSFDKFGYLKLKFNPTFQRKNMEIFNTKYPIILDCIWSPKNRTFYILDVLIWNRLITVDYEAEFRFFWIDSKLKEMQTLEFTDNGKIYHFDYLNHFNINQLEDQLKQYPNVKHSPKVDGLLFYQKDSFYISGLSPFFSWLKVYMVPDVLNINVPSHFLKEKPVNGIGIRDNDYDQNSNSDTSDSDSDEISKDSQNPIDVDMDVNCINIKLKLVD